MISKITLLGAPTAFHMPWFLIATLTLPLILVAYGLVKFTLRIAIRPKQDDKQVFNRRLNTVTLWTALFYILFLIFAAPYIFLGPWESSMPFLSFLSLHVFTSIPFLIIIFANTLGIIHLKRKSQVLANKQSADARA